MTRVLAGKLVGIAVALVGACAAGRPSYRARIESVFAEHPLTTDRRIPAPVALVPHAWDVGEWALFRWHTAEGDGFELVSVAAIDACGIWIVDEWQAPAEWRRTRACFWPASSARLTDDRQLRMAIVELNDAAPEVLDFSDGAHQREKAALEAAFARFTPRPFADAGHREDVAVPAGHFAQAIRLTDSGITRWLHPDVPFDTIQQRSSDGDSFTLLAFGFAGESAVEELASSLAAARAPYESPPSFIGLGLAVGAYNGASGNPTTPAYGADTRIGRRVTPTFELLLEFTTVERARASSARLPGPRVMCWEAGVRWTPFGPNRAAYPNVAFAEALYLRAAAGYAELDRRIPDDTNPRGLVVGEGIGWRGLQAHDWAMGIEVAYRAAVMNQSEGLRQALSVTTYFELHMP